MTAKPTEYERGYSAGWDDAKAEAMLMLSELVQTVGDNAMEILIRNEPDASIFRQHSVRQSYSAPIRRMLPKEAKDDPRRE